MRAKCGSFGFHRSKSSVTERLLPSSSYRVFLASATPSSKQLLPRKDLRPQFEQCRAQRVNIAAMVDGLRARGCLFGVHVVWRAQHRASHAHALLVETSSQPKIGQPNMIVFQQ